MQSRFCGRPSSLFNRAAHRPLCIEKSRASTAPVRGSELHHIPPGQEEGAGGGRNSSRPVPKEALPFPALRWLGNYGTLRRYTYTYTTRLQKRCVPLNLPLPQTHILRSDITIPGWVQTTTRPQQMRQNSEVPFPLISPPEGAMAGRLRFFLKNWQSLTTDWWVLEAVSGFHLPHTPTILPPNHTDDSGGNTLHQGGDPIPPTDWHHHGAAASPSRILFLHSLHSPQEGWRSAAHNKPRGAEQVRPPPSLQDGGNPDSERYHLRGGLHVQVGSEGRLFYDPNCPSPPEVSLF